MRRAPALAGTFFNNWANYGFKETVRETRRVGPRGPFR